MKSFIMNGILWRVETVNPDSPYLIDRTDQYKLATTDPNEQCIFLSRSIPTTMKDHVLIHELGHCAIFSYDLFKDFSYMVKPEYLIDIEEWICNFIADYGELIFSIFKDINKIPAELEKLVA